MTIHFVTVTGATHSITYGPLFSTRATRSYLNEVEELTLGGREVRLRRGVLRVALFGRTL